MFNADPKVMQRIAAKMQRVLVIDPSSGAARLLGDLLKDMGARQALTAANGAQALALASTFEPELIVTELVGPQLDGLDFTRKLRRSALACRQAPVIVVTIEATAESILAARNAGMHEFLRKPFTAGDIYRRVENVILKPRPWIEAQMYVGPDRRRFNSGEFAGASKRRSDAAPAAKAG